MSATEPAQVIEQFVKFFNSGDLDGLMDNLYEDDVVFVPAPGADIAQGKPAVRENLAGFLDLKGTMTILSGTAFQNGDLALTHAHWKLEVPGQDAIEATTAEVVRRQSDGSWKYVVDNPWGGAILG
jgi:uncharacterized protein (TIGR02246 family)